MTDPIFQRNEAFTRFGVTEDDIAKFAKGIVDPDKINVALAADYLKMYTELSVRNFAIEYLKKYYVFDNLKQYSNYTFFKKVLDYFYTYEVDVEAVGDADINMRARHFFNVPKNANSREILNTLFASTRGIRRVSVGKILPLNIQHTADITLEEYMLCYEGLNTSVDD